MSAAPFKMAAPGDVYRNRRRQLGKGLRRPLVLFAGRAPARNYATNPHPFRAGSTYLYFGGPPMEGAAWLIEPGCDGEGGCTLLREPQAADDVVWVGRTQWDADIATAAGLGVHNLDAVDQLQNRLGGRAAGCIAPPCLATWKCIEQLGLAPASADESTIIIDMRLIKDEHELRRMREAAAIGVEVHRAALRAVRPGAGEADVAAAMQAVLTARQCQPSFTPIATIRGEILHHQVYTNRITDGALMLIDAGAEEPCGYASDITRTCPANGRWTSIQRQLYDVVHLAMREAIAACVPGRRYRDIHDLAAVILCKGLADAGLLKGTAEDLFERKAHTLFFPHGVGHLIGLDVHDMEDYGDLAGYPPGRTRRTGFGDRFLRLDRDLQAGMCVTIEPGLYLVPAIWETSELVAELADVVNRKQVDGLLKAHFGGIRIEEDVHVRDPAQGEPEVLTAELPSDPDNVAKCVGNPT